MRFILFQLLFTLMFPCSISAQPRYEGQLVLLDVAASYVDDGKHDPGHTEFQLIEDFTFVDEFEKRWTVPAGTVVNGASIPKILWSDVGGPWSGKYRRASVFHDYMCVAKISTHEEATRVFYSAMIASGVSQKKAKLMSVAVYHFGPRWEFTNQITGSRALHNLPRREMSRRDLNILRGKVLDGEITIENLTHQSFDDIFSTQ